MTRTFWICMFFFLIGVIIVALPDTGQPVFSITGIHGPSIIDVVGLVILLTPWTYMITFSILKWRRVLFTLGRRFAAIAIGLAGAGLGVVAVSLSRNTDTWVIGALVAFLGQLAWMLAAFKRK